MEDLSTPLAIAFVGALFASQLNALLQQRLIKIHNKHKTIDILFQYVGDFERMYVEYWKQQGKDPEADMEIRMQQVKIHELLYFAKNEYGIKHTGQQQLKELIKFATSDGYETKDRNPDLEKCTQISHLANKLVITLLKNKI